MLRLVQKHKPLLDFEDLDDAEFKWLDLGRVAYGLRNDEGSVHVHMKIGYLVGNRPDYPGVIVKVIEKYYGEEYGIRHTSPHKVESVNFHKPNNLSDLIERFSGEDKRNGVLYGD